MSKKIIDSFIFYNEIDLLTYRLNILDPIVDYFVIVESTHTFSGKEKPLFFNENRNLFEKFINKIIHIIVDDFPYKYPNIDYEKQQQWENEKYQRNCISRGIDLIENKNENDLIIISDLDEIPDPRILLKIKNGEIIVHFNSLEMDAYYYNLNLKFEKKWCYSKIIIYSIYKSSNLSIQQIRMSCNQPIINNAGWHLSYFGDNEFIKNKLINFSYQEYNNDSFTNLDFIKSKIENNMSLFDNKKIEPIPIYKNDNLPPKYNIYLTKFYKNISKKLAFYTYFYGSDNNHSFRIPQIPSLKYNCYYYTNNKTIFEMLKDTNWIRIYDDKPTNDDVIESCMIGKHIKTMPHKYNELVNYDYLCFLDSKLQKVNEMFVEDFITKYFIEANYALLLREHWFVHNNVWNEYNESMYQERYRLESEKYKNYINKQIQNGLSEVTEHHCACGFLIRNMKHEKINNINETWYQNIQECGIQDQISFFFVKQLFEGYIHFFTEIPFC